MQYDVSRNGKLLLVAAVLVASALVRPSAAVLAATPDQPAGQQAAADQQAGSFKNTCADQRDWVAAEAGYPGSLLEMAKQSLADCEGKQQASK